MWVIVRLWLEKQLYWAEVQKTEFIVCIGRKRMLANAFT